MLLSLARRGRNGTASFYGVQQSLLEPGMEPANRFPACNDLHARHRALRRLEPPGMGCWSGSLGISSSCKFGLPVDLEPSGQYTERLIWLLPRVNNASAARLRASHHTCQMRVRLLQSRKRPCALKFLIWTFLWTQAGGLRAQSRDTRNKVTALIGPSGCGKSTFLRTLNRMNDSVRNNRYVGEILLDGQDISKMDVVNLRRRVGMVFRPKILFRNPFTIMSRTVFASTDTPAIWTIWWKEFAPRRALGRSEGLSAQISFRAIGRPAAAAVHRTCAGRRSRSAAS